MGEGVDLRLSRIRWTWDHILEIPCPGFPIWTETAMSSYLIVSREMGKVIFI